MASSAPVQGQTAKLKLSPLGLPILHKQISVKVAELPLASANMLPETAIGSSSKLTFDLTQADEVFTYQLAINQTTTKCESNDNKLSCPLEPLSLKPGKTYEYSLERLFGTAPTNVVLTSLFTTLDPVILQKSSIAKGSTVYSKPSSMTLRFNKPIAEVEGLNLGDKEITWRIDDTKLIVNFANELQRKTDYSLAIEQLTATDGSQLLEPFKLSFRTSGGPKVSGVSIASRKVSTYSNVVIGFDSTLDKSQKLSKFASIEVSGKSVAATVSFSSNQITINPHADLPRCTSFTVRIKAGLINKYGIGEGEAWSMNARTICQVVYSIGSSVQGRSILAYRFGSGSSEVVFVGGTHGNEKSSFYTLNAWIDYLESNPHIVTGNRSVIIIPNLNPDGFASSSRTNANNVDLNRNFPSNDWQKSIQMPGGVTLPKGGGNAALDQPESKALAKYIQSISPRLVLTYHAVARIVISNDIGDSVALGKKYASASGYSFTSNANSHGTFEYATTGEFEDWLADKENTPALLIELGTMAGNELYTHRTAMIQMAQLP